MDSKVQLTNLEVDNKAINNLILAILAVIPLVTHLKQLQFISPNIDPFITLSTGTPTDFFTYYKFILLFLFTSILIILFVYNIYISNPTLKINKMNIFLISFLLSLVISLLVSEYKTIALWGSYSRHGGFLTYFSLISLMLVIINTKYKTINIDKIFYALYPFTIINSILVVLHFFNFNVLNSSLVKLVILGKYAGTRLTEGSYIVGTVGHYNYTSALGAIVFAIFCTKALLVANNRMEKLINLSMAILGGTIVFGSGALNGMITLIFMLIIIAGLIFERKSLQEIYIFIGLVFVLTFEFYLFNLYDSTLIKDVVSNYVILSLTFILSVLALLVFFYFKYRPKVTVKRILTSLTVISVLVVSLTWSIGDQIVSKIDQELTKMDSETTYQNLMTDDFDMPEYSWTIGTGRLYIWKETLELISKKPLLGYGLDTLTFTLDQGDPAKISSMNKEDVIIDKPHNTYLGVLYGSGLIAFLAYLLIISQVLIKGFKMVIRKTSDYELQWPLLLGIIAYLYQGMFNDSVIGLQIVFWVFMGYSYLLAVKE
ncbi:MAG: hypothetical protein APF84_18550 [Gracilibacter sp. BRH_c7a]|nr:MAG: hypothetical protein APF84_18550 [Gracilibacter sp. BRH_c7a]